MDDVRNALGQATEVDVTVARHQWTVWATNLDRLTAFKDGPTGTVIDGYSYDATGNRLSAQVNGGTQTYNYPTDSHRLAGVTGAARSYDGAGNTTAIDGTAREFAYDATGRLSQAKRSGTLAMEYRYNDRGEQVRRFLGTTNTYTVYDEAGHWLGDYDDAGKPLQQAIWLDNLPVGVLAGTVLNYVQPDHLGAPRTVIDPVRDVAIWKWDIKGEAFGNTPPDQNADRDGTAFVFGMRFPGQRYDSATGLNQNYHRDYDASAGRYGQSDPLGLDGGIDTYAYVNGSSLGYIDPFGLARTSIDSAIQQALMRGDVGELETILEAAATNEERAAARAAIDRLNSRVGNIVSKECRGSINREFPGQYREKTLQELLRDKNAGDSAARKAWKLINDSRFKK